MRKRIPRMLAIFMISTGLIVPVFGAPPVLAMLVSQVSNIAINPLIILLMIILQNNKEIMGEYKAGLQLNIWLVVIFLFSVLMSIVGIAGVVNIL